MHDLRCLKTKSGPIIGLNKALAKSCDGFFRKATSFELRPAFAFARATCSILRLICQTEHWLILETSLPAHGSFVFGGSVEPAGAWLFPSRLRLFVGFGFRLPSEKDRVNEPHAMTSPKSSKVRHLLPNKTRTPNSKDEPSSSRTFFPFRAGGFLGRGGEKPGPRCPSQPVQLERELLPADAGR